jgi:protease IV
MGDYALRQGVGVRAAGMGGAFTAIADDGSAIFYNPAGLATPGFCYTFGNPDTNQKKVTGSFELLKLGYIGYGNWGVKDSTSNEVKATAIGFGNRNGWLSWGLSFKSLNWNTTGAKMEGWSGDVGFLARITPRFNLGLLVQDLITSKDFLMPAAGRLGFSYRPLNSYVTMAGDLEFGRSSMSYGHLGIEARIMKGLAFRGGFDRGNSTLGCTLDLALFSFDYAVLFSENGGATQRFETGIKILPDRERPFSIIGPKEFALVDVSGAIKGGRDEFSFLGGMKPGLDSILSQIRKINKDSSIDGIMLRIGGFNGGLGGMAIVQEIRGELEKSRKSGKKIVAFLEGGAFGDEYYLASVADKIIAPPGAAVGGFGKSLEIYRIKGLYEKIGIQSQTFTQGDYKAAFDPFNTDMTEKQEDMVRGLLADLYRRMLNDIAEDRGLEISEVKEIGDGMFFTARQAKALGLIDDIGYFDDAKKIASEICGDKKEAAKIVEPRQITSDRVFLTRFFGVAVIEIDGEIVSRGGGENIIFGGRYVGSETVVKYIRQASDDLFVKAIILRINSPGGGAIAAGEIYEALKYAKEKEKVIIASIGNVGASGGYYIAAGADKIVADPSSITGSIGVIGYFTKISDLLEKLDIEVDVIKEGKHADMFSGLRDLTTEEVAAINELQAESYNEFIDAVAAGRDLTTAEVKEAAQGKIYTGEQALELDLVDQLGGFSDAIELAKKEADIFGEPRLIFYHEPSIFFSFGAGMVESLGLRELIFWNLLQNQEEYN